MSMLSIKIYCIIIFVCHFIFPGAAGAISSEVRHPICDNMYTCYKHEISYVDGMTAIYTMPGHLIRRLQQISVSIFAENMKANGIDLTSPQFAALTILGENPGIDQATLAGMIALDRPTIGGVVERLANKGLVERKISDADRRAKRLSLTPEGMAMVRRMHPLVVASQAKILEGLSDQEKHQFTVLAEKITRLHNDQSRAPLILPEKKRQTDIG